MERIEKDQFLELVTVKTEVRTVCKELYRSVYEPHFLLFCFAFSPVD